MARHNQTGRWGENVATEYLVTRGYDILERNWRLNHLEIDIIARQGQRISFIEVKSRNTDEHIDPIDLITPRKVGFMRSCANAYMSQYGDNFSCQFDFIFVMGSPNDYTVEHFPDAFFPPMKTYR
ncbi:MAG: YraN family protein [Muribaculaceae bacterium]|nr:YraN family protein [Muribaculaceae bacterium]